MISRAQTFSSISPTARRPVISLTRSISADTATHAALPGSANPSASVTVWQVFAVPMMGHAPAEPYRQPSCAITSSMPISPML